MKTAVMHKSINAYLRPDGRKGIRNILTVAYLVECAKHVAEQIVAPYREQGVQLIGFSGCYPNAYSQKMLQRLCTHSNVGGALLLSLGCEGFDRHSLKNAIAESGRPVDVLGIQQVGGTRKTIEAGRQAVEAMLSEMEKTPRVAMDPSEVIIGTICGGSDATSGITANPAIGHCFDAHVAAGGITIFEETGELIGCEPIMRDRATSPDLGAAIVECVGKAARYYDVMGHGSFAPGNADGGLTTQEEKSLGAYAKSGSSAISGIIKPGDQPSEGGLYLLDVVPDGEVRFGFPNINDNAEIAELIACGSHIILFATGRGSVVGSVISPVVKVCANPETYRHMSDDMDINAGRILEGVSSLAEVGEEIHDYTMKVAEGQPTCSEALGHQEFVLTYKHFEGAAGPSCFPG
ncbi:MAG: UxaA family hydrolase [Opitutales bacterium]|nr:UxaA family hydrolase [Opitutales bacterium]